MTKISGKLLFPDSFSQIFPDFKACEIYRSLTAYITKDESESTVCLSEITKPVFHTFFNPIMSDLSICRHP